MAGTGLDISRLFGLDPGPVNFSGVAVRARHPDVGAQ